MIRFEDVSFHYGGEHGTGEGVDHIRLTIEKGEMVVLIGPSGCGKTTLTRLINGLAPHFFEGEMEGSVWIENHCVNTSPLSQTSPLVGSVFQNPKSQFFNLDTTGELVFGCENQGLPREEIHRRLEMTRKDLKLDGLLSRNIFELSGGEKQQIACGGAYATRPPIYVLDEPSSNLDQKAIRRLRDLLRRVKRQKSTVVISEHRLHYLMDLADRFVYLEDGVITREFTPCELSRLSEAELGKLGLRCTSLQMLEGKTEEETGEETEKGKKGAKIEALDLSCIRGGEQILEIGRLSLPEHGIIAMIGDNGAGKSTLTESLCGVIPSNGSIAFDGVYLTDKERARKSFLVMQDVNRQLFSDSVLEEVRLNSQVSEKEAKRILEELGLAGLESRHPSSLSGGQKQRVAIACALCGGKEILFFDEPTSGLDRQGMERFGQLLKTMKSQVTSVIITHDPELILNCCSHVLHVENGRVLGFYPLGKNGISRMCSYFLSRSEDRGRPHRKKKGVLERLVFYAGEGRKNLYGAIALMFAGSAASVGGYLGVYDVCIRLLEEGRLRLTDCLPAAGILLLSGLIYALTYSFGLALSHRCAYQTLENLRIMLQERLERQPLGTVQELGTGAVKKLFTEDIEGIEILLAHVIPEGIANLAVPLAVLLVLIAVDWQMGLLTFLMVGFGLGASKKMVEVGMDRMGNYFASAKRLNNTILSFVSGMEVIRVFNRQGESGRRFDDAVNSYRDLALDWYRICWPWMAIYGNFFTHVTLYSLPFGALMVILHHLSLSRYVLALCLSFSIGGVLLRTLALWGAFPQVNYKLQSLEKALDYPPLRCGEEQEKQASGEEKEPGKEKAPGEGEKPKKDGQEKEEETLKEGRNPGGVHSLQREREMEVVFDQVHFSYKGDEVLKGVSFTCKEGELTALVGESGSGKTTLARLLVHYMDPSYGEIRIGGRPLTDLTLKELNQKAAFVSQDLFLFRDTILENIRVGRAGASDEEVYEAARKAGCEEFIERLPDGYHTQAGAAGNQLSGGQKQRIAFARVLLKDSPIIVLDEATAFLDPENEQRMNEAIASILEGKTVLVIAHKLSSIISADKVILLKEGMVHGEGTHEELMNASEEYQRLWATTEEGEDFVLRGGGEP